MCICVYLSFHKLCFYHEEIVLQNVALNTDEKEVAGNSHCFLRFICFNDRTFVVFNGEVLYFHAVLRRG